MKGAAGAASRPKNDIIAYRIADYLLRAGLRVLPASKQSEHLALWWGFKFRPNPSVSKLRSGALIYVDPTDYLQLLIHYLGTFEPHCLRYLKSCVSKGGTVIDVGANIGVYTLESAIVVGPAGRVISIEAAPSNARLLKQNIELNHMNNVTVVEVAAGDSTGSETLSLPSEGNLGMFSLGSQVGDKFCSVNVRRIDDLLEERAISSVDFIRMDVEGSEYRALRGGTKTLESYRPTILIELNEKALRSCQSSSKEVKELLASFGYRGWVIERKTLRPIQSSRSVHDCDECLFIHRDNKMVM